MAHNAGLQYEQQVRSVVRSAAKSIEGFSVSTIGGHTFADQADLTLLTHKGRYSVEIKLDGRAQMGNPMTVLYHKGIFNVKHDDTVDGVTEEVVLEELGKKRREFDRFLDFVRSQKPAYNLQADQVPVTCTKKAWDAAVSRGLVRSLNSKVRMSVDVIARYYQKKGTHYIQIGNQGFFHLGKNPLLLPVPMLRGEVDLELRLSHHGAKPNKEVGERVTADLRCIARLLTRDKSKFTIDERDDVLMLFGGKKK